MTRAPALLALAALAACFAPVPDPTQPVVRVAIGDSLDGTAGWVPEQRAALLDELAALAALGPEFRPVSPGEADVVVRAARLDGAGACGRYVLGGTVVEVDPACTMGLDGVRKAVGHELFHFVLITRFAWPGHLCRWAINERAPAGCHPTIQCPASGCLLEAGLRGAPVDGVEDYVATFADGSVTDADRELLRGCVARGRCE